MPQFQNLQAMYRYIEEQAIKKGLLQVAQEMKDILRQYMQDKWYTANSPALYERTYQILESISISNVEYVGGWWQVKIFFDDSKIQPMQSTFDVPDGLTRFNHHMSVNKDTDYQGVSIGQWVAIWMNEGQNSPLHSYEGSNYFDDALAHFKSDNTLVKGITMALKAKGINIG